MNASCGTLLPLSQRSYVVQICLAAMAGWEGAMAAAGPMQRGPSAADQQLAGPDSGCCVIGGFRKAFAARNSAGRVSTRSAAVLAAGLTGRPVRAARHSW